MNRLEAFARHIQPRSAGPGLHSLASGWTTSTKIYSFNGSTHQLFEVHTQTPPQLDFQGWF